MSDTQKGDRNLSVETESELQEIGRRLTQIEQAHPGATVRITSREPNGISVSLMYEYKGTRQISFDSSTGKSSEVREEKYGTQTITDKQIAQVKNFLFEALRDEDLKIIVKYFELRETTVRPRDAVRPKIELIFGREN